VGGPTPLQSFLTVLPMAATIIYWYITIRLCPLLLSRSNGFCPSCPPTRLVYDMHHTSIIYFSRP
jgi:hypothetical protein